jgi:hypothetical protein
MNMLVMILALGCAGVLETAWPAAAALGQAKPPLVMGLILYYAMCRSLPLMLAAAVLGGVMSASLNALPLGAMLLGLAGIGLLVRGYREMVFSGQWLTRMVLGAAAGLGLTMILFVWLGLADSGLRGAAPEWVLMKILGAGLYGLLLAPVIFWLMEHLDRMVGNLRMEAEE